MEKDILLENGTKEVEILEFKAGGISYGINVNEIREILAFINKPTPVPNAHPLIEGIIMPRDFVITVLDFNKCFPTEYVEEAKNEMIINTRYNDIAIHVDSVNGIHRQVESDITSFEGSEEEYSELITGVVAKEDRNLNIIDFIKLFETINPEVSIA
jgi:Chemotaxis signal transduction protein